MYKDIRYSYECENCAGTFTIIPEMDETIKYCPQCGCVKVFKSVIAVEDEEDKAYAQFWT